MIDGKLYPTPWYLRLFGYKKNRKKVLVGIPFLEIWGFDREEWRYYD